MGGGGIWLRECQRAEAGQGSQMAGASHHLAASASSEHPFAGGIQAEAEMLPATNAPEGFWEGAWLVGKTKDTVFSRGTHWDTIL